MNPSLVLTKKHAVKECFSQIFTDFTLIFADKSSDLDLLCKSVINLCKSVRNKKVVIINSSGRRSKII